jgi:hypothetical protein
MGLIVTKLWNRLGVEKANKLIFIWEKEPYTHVLKIKESYTPPKNRCGLHPIYRRCYDPHTTHPHTSPSIPPNQCLGVLMFVYFG